MNSALYKLLGLSPDATPEQIKAAYRRKAMETHPDRNGEESRESFELVNRAYRVLSNPLDRAYYDRTGQEPTPEKEGITGQAVGIISNWLCQVIDGAPGKLSRLDLIALLNNQVGTERSTLRQAHRDISKKLRRTLELKKRLEVKKDNNPFLLSPAIRERETTYIAALRNVERAKRTLEVVKTIIDDHTYRFETGEEDKFSSFDWAVNSG